MPIPTPIAVPTIFKTRVCITKYRLDTINKTHRRVIGRSREKRPVVIKTMIWVRVGGEGSRGFRNVFISSMVVLVDDEADVGELCAASASASASMYIISSVTSSSSVGVSFDSVFAPSFSFSVLLSSLSL
mmetsp:Transcript_29219/g.43447  ORF Transcript_29219/g.43447 Transcript_29219/m.43447 type:complete len:130 (+) Transcript_29219:1875-2264(+)